eukprot:2310920-Rhodomonas_salina.1
MCVGGRGCGNVCGNARGVDLAVWGSRGDGLEVMACWRLGVLPSWRTEFGWCSVGMFGRCLREWVLA